MAHNPTIVRYLGNCPTCYCVRAFLMKINLSLEETNINEFMDTWCKIKSTCNIKLLLCLGGRRRCS